MLKKFHTDYIHRVKTPFLLTLAGNENQVDNDAARKFFKECTI